MPTLPTGVSQTNLGVPVLTQVLTNFNSVMTASVATGPIVGLTASNSDYGNQIFSVFTDFGTPAGAGSRPAGLQRHPGERRRAARSATPTTIAGQRRRRRITQPAATTLFRRFYGIAFDQYGYFSQGMPVVLERRDRRSAATAAAHHLTRADRQQSARPMPAACSSATCRPGSTSLSHRWLPCRPRPILDPGPGSGSHRASTTDSAGDVIPVISHVTATRTARRLRRPDRPDHARRPRSTSSPRASTPRRELDASSFIDSTLSIGSRPTAQSSTPPTTPGIWQFKTTASLADSTSGSLIGLNDLRTLGVPYDGQNSAVAVVDTGVDATAPRSAAGSPPATNVITGGLGNDGSARARPHTAARPVATPAAPDGRRRGRS